MYRIFFIWRPSNFVNSGRGSSSPVIGTALFKTALFVIIMCHGNWLHFINVLRTAFTWAEHKSVKRTVKFSKSFYAFGICVRKSCE